MMTSLFLPRMDFSLFAVIAICFCILSQAVADESGENLPYEVTCSEGDTCVVDKSTYKGWRSYHAFCHVCHAQDAIGSTFAPSLVDRLKGMEKARFVDVVTNGYNGQVGVMPAWKDNPNVMPQMDDLWSYLRARSDGALKPGRPERKK